MLNTSKMHAGYRVLGALALAAAVLAAPAADAKQKPQPLPPPPTNDWLWLSANEVNCTWTIKVDWNGYTDARTLQAFVTVGYTGSPIASTYVPITPGQTTATVTVGPLTPAAIGTTFYPWAQLLDGKGVAIPSSLDFSGGNIAYCAP